MPAETSDEDLAARTPHDLDCLAQLYARHSPTVLRYCERRVGPQVAEDLASETWTRVTRGIGGFTPRGPGSFLGWTLSIANRLVISEYAASQRRAVPADSDFERPSEDPAPEDVAVKHEERERVVRIMLTLRAPQLRIVRLRFYDGLSVAETAQAVGKSEGAVRVMQHRALRDLGRRIAS